MEDKHSTSPTEETSTSTSTDSLLIILRIVLQSLLAAVILFSNGLVICAIGRTPRLQTVTNYFVLSLAVADLLIGIVLPINITLLLKLWHSCLANNIMMIIPCLISELNLLMIAVDRHQAVVHPLHYPTRISPTRAKLAICVCWIVCVAFAMTLPLYNRRDESAGQAVQEICLVYSLKPHTMLTLFGFFATTVLFIVSLYGHIFRVAYRQTVQVWAQTAAGDKAMRTAKSFILETKTTKTLCFVLGAFTMSWMPFHVLLALDSFNVEVPGISLVHQIAVPLLVANSCMNPVIYAWRNKDFRRVFKRLLTKGR